MAARGKYDKENIAMLIAKLWGGITDDQFDLLKEHLEIKKYKKNEIIYKNEGTPEYALCLIAGKVKIYKEGIGGKSQIIRVIKPIEFFGFRAYFVDEIYKTAAMSLENCIVAQFPLAVLMKQVSPKKVFDESSFAEPMVNAVTVWKIITETVTGKRHE